VRQEEREQEEFSRYLGPDPWCVDRVRHDGEVFTVTGWALAPGGRHEEVTFRLNGREFERIEYPMPSAYLAQAFTFREDAKLSAFTCSSRVTRATAYPNGHAELTCASTTSPGPSQRCAFYYPDDRVGSPLPDVERQRRVAGGGIGEAFLLVGCSIFVGLEKVLGSIYGMRYDDFSAMLDWGCGCGRLTRYFVGRVRPTITGVDIDRDNVDWCVANLPFGTFATVPLHPPTRLPDGAFDLLVGISVFTHLQEMDQTAWLAELSRLARPGAVLLMTTHGTAAAVRSGMSLTQLRDWTRLGMVYYPGDSNLQGYIADDGYYGTSYVTPEFIRQRWTRYFAVDAILPGYVNHHHDLVVMRKSR